jgi:hypothetical protein
MADGRQLSISDGLSKGMSLVHPERINTFPEFECSVSCQMHDQIPPLQVPLSKDLAYFAGLFLGDGAKQGTTSVSITHGHVNKVDLLGYSYQDWQSQIVSLCQEVGFQPTPRVEGVYLGSRNVMRFLHSLSLIEGDPATGSRNLRIPRWVLSKKDFAISFLGGLFDTDGDVSKQDGTIRVLTKDPIFAGQLVSLLQTLGCIPTVEASYNKTYQRFYFRLSVRGYETHKIRCGMRHKGKIARFRDPKKGSGRKNEVLQILTAGELPCVDLSLGSEDHLYWVNGFITHNSTNFALCYGGGGDAVVASTGVSKEEGWRIKNKFQKAYPTLAGWWKSQHEFARRHGYVVTGFGRKCMLPDIHHENSYFASKAERNAVNSPVQGVGADIMKAAMPVGEVFNGDHHAR